MLELEAGATLLKKMKPGETGEAEMQICLFANYGS